MIQWYNRYSKPLDSLTNRFSELSVEIDSVKRRIYLQDSLCKAQPNLTRQYSKVRNLQNEIVKNIMEVSPYINAAISTIYAEKDPLLDSIWFKKDRNQYLNWLHKSKSVILNEIPALKAKDNTLSAQVNTSTDSLFYFRNIVPQPSVSVLSSITYYSDQLNVLNSDLVQTKEAIRLLSIISQLLTNYEAFASDILNNEQEIKEILSQKSDLIIEKSTLLKELNSTLQGKGIYSPNANHYYEEWLRSLEDIPALEFEIEKVEIEFNEGLIENIVVVGTFTRYNLIKWNNNVKTQDIKRIKFENKYPLGFSRKKDFVVLQQKALYADFEGQTLVMPLAELISIIVQKHEVNRRDFSPQNQIYQFDQNSPQCQTLKKEATFRLFEAKVYSDFIGLNEQSPNGVLQTEIGRRINMRTQRRYWKEKNSSPNYGLGDVVRHSGIFHRVPINSGFLTYIEPTFALTKIEEDGKFLKLSAFTDTLNIVGPDTVNRYYASTLNLHRYEKLNAGLTTNWAVFDIPNWKSSFYINTGIQFARIAVKDSILFDNNKEVVKGINTFSLLFEFPWEIKADERYGFTFFWRSRCYVSLSDKVIQTSFIPEKGKPKPTGPYFFAKSKWLNSAEISGYFNPWPYSNTKSKFFFRYRLTWDYQNPKRNFNQVQFGFSAYLTKK